MIRVNRDIKDRVISELVDKYNTTYFLIRYGENNTEESIYFFNYKGSWFETELHLEKVNIKNEEELTQYVKDTYYEEKWEEMYIYEKNHWSEKNGKLYALESFQCLPFLPNEYEIISPMTEYECIDWLLKHKNNV